MIDTETQYNTGVTQTYVLYQQRGSVMSAQHVQKHTKTFSELEFILGVLRFDNECVYKVVSAEAKDSFSYFYRAFLHKSLVKADQHLNFVCAKGNMSIFFHFLYFVSFLSF